MQPRNAVGSSCQSAMARLDAHWLLGGDEQHVPIGQYTQLSPPAVARSDGSNRMLQIQGSSGHGRLPDTVRRRAHRLGKWFWIVIRSVTWRSTLRTGHRPGSDIHIGHRAILGCVHPRIPNIVLGDPEEQAALLLPDNPVKITIANDEALALPVGHLRHLNPGLLQRPGVRNERRTWGIRAAARRAGQ